MLHEAFKDRKFRAGEMVQVASQHEARQMIGGLAGEARRIGEIEVELAQLEKMQDGCAEAFASLVADLAPILNSSNSIGSQNGSGDASVSSPLGTRLRERTHAARMLYARIIAAKSALEI